MLLFALLLTLFAARAFASFGYIDEGTYWTIDNGKNLVIEVSQTNGDIQSMKYNVSINLKFFHIKFWVRMSTDSVDPQGVEYNGYSNKNTQVETGLGASTVTIEEFTSPAYIIKVSVTYGTLKHC